MSNTGFKIYRKVLSGEGSDGGPQGCILWGTSWDFRLRSGWTTKTTLLLIVWIPGMSVDSVDGGDLRAHEGFLEAKQPEESEQEMNERLQKNYEKVYY